MASNTTQQAIPAQADKNTYSGYFNIVAWLITIGLFFLIAKTKIGYTFLFFFALASIIVVLAIGSPTITAIFATVNPQATKAPGATHKA